MPKIGKIRFINFTYNDNRHIYDQTFDFYNGEDTLLNLQNGGGKTVLVQMMMQPIIPNQKLKDRLFKSYFMNAKAPVYIMLEWILEGSSKRVLTGIGIKRVQGKSIEDEATSLRLVTFISEYMGGSNYDIKNIPLTYEEKGIIKLVDFDKVLKTFSDAEKEGNNIWLYRLNMSDDKKEYARRLSEYKINPSEWRNLMVKINEAEAGLNSFFNDCKTNKALIKKWFIPTIEDQLNKNGDSIQNIRELIKNHAEQLVKNEDMIKEREIYEDFKIKSEGIIKSLKENMDIIEKSDKNKSDIGNAYLLIDDMLKKLSLDTEETHLQRKQCESKIIEFDYQRLSCEYYAIEDDLQKLNQKIISISAEIDDKNVEKEQYENRKNLLSCSKLKEEITNLNIKIAKFEAELKKEAMQQEDLNNIINDLSYSIKIKYQEKIEGLKTALNNAMIKLSDNKNRLSQNQNDASKINHETALLNEQLIGIKSRISVFDELKDNLSSLHHEFNPVKNMDTGEYGTDTIEELKKELDAEETDIVKKLSDIKEKRANDRERLINLEAECRKTRDEYPLLAIEKKEKESAYQLFQKEKQEILRILRAYQLSEDCLYDTEKILIPLNSDREKYQKLINDINLENSIYNRQLKQYESGKSFELPDDLKQMLDEKNVFLEFGHDWLRSLPDHKKVKQRMVRNNPFLPYAMIVSRKDFDIIKDMRLEGVLSPVIPIIEREKLEKAFSIKDLTKKDSTRDVAMEISAELSTRELTSNDFFAKNGNHIYTMEDIHFLITFDDRVLNKIYLKELCDDISSKITKNNEVIENAQSALEHIATDIIKVESFSYTKHETEKLYEEAESVKEKLKENSSKITMYESDILAIKKNEMEDLSLLSNLENEKNKFIRKKEDILSFIKRCRQYSNDLKDRIINEAAIKCAYISLSEKESDIAKIKEAISESDFKIKNIASILEKDKLQYQKYADVESGKFIDEELENLESKLAAYTSKVSGKVQTLQDILEDYRRQRENKQEIIKSYGLEENLYIGMEYRAFEYDKLEEEISKITGIISELSIAKNEIQFKTAERTSDLRYRKKSLAEQCGLTDPLPRDAIMDLDFEKEKKLQKAILKDLEKNISRIREQETKLQRIRFRLEEYKEFAHMVSDIKTIEGDIDEYVLNLIKEYKKYTALLNDSRSTIAAHYNAIENEFIPKAEMFKSLFHSILNGERKYQPSHALNALNRVFLQIDRKLEQYSIDIKKIDDMEKYIIDNTLSYLKNVYDEMNLIDRNSSIELDGKRLKMLIISLPESEALESISLKEYLKSTINSSAGLFKNGKAMEGFLTNEINTFNLFDRFVGVNKIGITLMKIEPNKLKKKTWAGVIAENSGGELFVSAFVVFISLLTYMRGEIISTGEMDGKVLIMDNPFGPITSEHLLKPLFEISKKYNTQLICLTDVKGHAIYDRFNLIYSINIEREVGREDEYIELKTIKKDVTEKEDEVLAASMFKIEDKARFELAD